MNTTKIHRSHNRESLMTEILHRNTQNVNKIEEILSNNIIEPISALFPVKIVQMCTFRVRM